MSSSTEARRSPIGMLFAHLQLRAPDAQTFLLAAPRSSTRVRALARELAEVAVDAGCRVRLVDFGSGEEPISSGASAGAVDRGPSGPALEVISVSEAQLATLGGARQMLTGHTGLTIAYGGGLLDSPGAIIAAAVVDAVIVVARKGKTARADLEQVRLEVERAGGRVVGSVLVD